MQKNNHLSFYILFKQLGAGKKWKTLRHNGILFPPNYVKHNIPILYDGNPIVLSDEAEEYATIYAKYIKTDYVKNPKFNKNFWNDWKEYLGKDSAIKSLEKCDFSLIINHLENIKKETVEKNKGDKELMKKKREEIENKYKTAIVDGVEQPVGNFRIEPPSIFIGRGNHPKIGKIKKRLYPEDVTINIGRGEPIPEIPDFLSGHKWGSVIHNNNVEWLSSWKDTINDKTKYVWLGSQSNLKVKNDIDKFNLAKKLKKKIKNIREINLVNMKSSDIKVKQIATALYFIEKFALRVGNEKGTDEADTVGVTSLRVEHIDLLEDGIIKLDFFGKDSVRYLNKVRVDPIVLENIKEFIKGKDSSDKIFDRISTSELNKYLQDFMDDLTAKVFRTFGASYLFQKELNKITEKYKTYDRSDKTEKILDEFNAANAKVAILCNHQKKVPKSFDNQIDKIKANLSDMKKKLNKIKNSSVKNKTEKIAKLKEKIKKMKFKKELKLELKNISLETSKINYIDPRITVAFMKKNNIDVNKLFSKKLQDKFKWAFDVDENYKF